MGKQVNGNGTEFRPRKVLLALRSQTMREHPDPTPVEIPEERIAQDNVEARLRNFIRGELSRAAEEDGFETEEEANDFLIPEDDSELDYLSGYQVHLMVAEANEEQVRAAARPQELPEDPGAAIAPEVDRTTGESLERTDEAPTASQDES